MGVLKSLTDEYFGKNIREEDKIDISELNVEIVSFTDNNGNYHGHGYRVKERWPNNEPLTSYEKAEELSNLIKTIIKVRGNECSLNDIDVSNIHSMCFYSSKFSDDVGVFYNLDFDGDISGWDMSNVRYTNYMFLESNFTGKNGIFKITKDCYIVEAIGMFFFSEFNTNIDDWEINEDCNMEKMFEYTPLKINNKLPDWYHINTKKERS